MDMISRRDIGALALASAAAAMLPLRHARAARADNSVVVAIPVDYLTLDPSRDISLNGVSLFSNLYERLTDIKADGTVGPMIGASWTSSPDAKTWDFTIASGPKFHDGTPVTADDVVWTYNTILNDATSPVRAYMGMIDTVTKQGTNVVRFALKQPYAPFDRQASLISILPQAAYTKAGAAAFAQHPIGSGPFRFVSWVRDDHMDLAAVDGYWRGKPTVATVRIKPIPAETSRTEALLSGDVDLVAQLPPAVVDRLSKSSAVRVVKILSNRVVYLGFNTNAAPLDNLMLRQAIDMCFDRNALATRLMRGMATPNGELVGPNVFGYDPSLAPTPYDQAKAKALVQQSGYHGQPIMLNYPLNYFTFGTEMAQALANSMQAIGITVTLQGLEVPAFYPLWLGNKFPGLFFFAMAPSTWDADVAVTNLLGTGSKGYWNSPELDRLLAAQRADGDPAKRKEDLAAIWKLVRDNVAYSVLYLENHAYGLAKGLDWQPRADTVLQFPGARWST